MRLLYWLGKDQEGRPRDHIESIIPNVVKVKLVLDPENYMFVADVETHFLVTVPGITEVKIDCRKRQAEIS